ncbi:MAG: prepilin-type N-terminal cleavage/methylation domain-containing protein [Deltaproteobacteria bacterium]|nr:prepilin-type N-terminal cleavage/methylation domain-containing protein [Deltaproteobacteria bacterium]
MRRSGFTLIELMVAMVVGLTVITSVYSLGSAMSRQFYEASQRHLARGSLRLAQRQPRVYLRYRRPDSSAARRWHGPHGRLSVLRGRRSDRPRPEQPQQQRPRGPTAYSDQPVPERSAAGSLHEHRRHRDRSANGKPGLSPHVLVGPGRGALHEWSRTQLSDRRARLEQRLERRDRELEGHRSEGSASVSDRLGSAHRDAGGAAFFSLGVREDG